MWKYVCILPSINSDYCQTFSIVTHDASMLTVQSSTCERRISVNGKHQDMGTYSETSKYRIDLHRHRHWGSNCFATLTTFFSPTHTAHSCSHFGGLYPSHKCLPYLANRFFCLLGRPKEEESENGGKCAQLNKFSAVNGPARCCVGMNISTNGCGTTQEWKSGWGSGWAFVHTFPRCISRKLYVNVMCCNFDSNWDSAYT